MTQHITQEQVAAIATPYAVMMLPKADIANMMNAAIQHYLDQHKAELPVLPAPDKAESGWTEPVVYYFLTEKVEAYGQQCAAHARKLALMDAIKQVTILYEKDDYPVLTDICNLIATAK